MIRKIALVFAALFTLATSNAQYVEKTAFHDSDPTTLPAAERTRLLNVYLKSSDWFGRFQDLGSVEPFERVIQITDSKAVWMVNRMHMILHFNVTTKKDTLLFWYNDGEITPAGAGAGMSLKPGQLFAKAVIYTRPYDEMDGNRDQIGLRIWYTQPKMVAKVSRYFDPNQDPNYVDPFDEIFREYRRIPRGKFATIK